MDAAGPPSTPFNHLTTISFVPSTQHKPYFRCCSSHWTWTTQSPKAWFHHVRSIWNLCDCVYMQICKYAYMYICIYVYMYICIYVCMYICMYINICLCIYANICIICIYKYTYVYVYIYICICICNIWCWHCRVSMMTWRQFGISVTDRTLPKAFNLSHPESPSIVARWTFQGNWLASSHRWDETYQTWLCLKIGYPKHPKTKENDHFPHSK